MRPEAARSNRGECITVMLRVIMDMMNAEAARSNRGECITRSARARVIPTSATILWMLNGHSWRRRATTARR